MYHNNPNLKKNKALHLIWQQEETICIFQAIKQARNFSNTQSNINTSHYWNHICNQPVCISCDVRASKWKPVMYNDAMYDPEEDPYNLLSTTSPVVLQTLHTNVHLCPEFMQNSNWGFAGPSANGRCQPCLKHLNSNRNCDWTPYKDQEVPKHIQ